jgi:hypothetical protein
LAAGLEVTICDLQFFEFGIREPEHEISRKSSDVTLDGLKHGLGRDTVKSRQIRVDDHTLAPHDMDQLFYGQGNGCRLCGCLTDVFHEYWM